MTEAYRPTQGEILTTPVDLAGVKNVTNTAPKASRNDLSHDMMAGPSFRDRALAVALALSTLGGAKVILDSQTAKGQSPSPAPSIGASFEPGTSPVATDPITGLPCVPGEKPTPEPSKAPLPSLPPDIGMVPGGEVELFAFANTGGDSVKVTVGAQSEPSLAPSVAPEASPEASQDPETAKADCTPAPEKTPLVDLDIIAEKDKILDQNKKQIKKVKFAKLQQDILGDPENPQGKPGFWNTHQEELAKLRTWYDTPLTRTVFENYLHNISLGPDSIQGDPEASIAVERQAVDAGFVTLFLFIADTTNNQEIRDEALRLADMAFDYGVRGINKFQDFEANLADMKFKINDTDYFYNLENQ